LGPHLNGIHLCCALSQAASIAMRRQPLLDWPDPTAGAAAAEIAAAGQEVLQQARELAAGLAPGLMALMHTLGPREVSTLIYSW
jgi:hypothetical protein